LFDLLKNAVWIPCVINNIFEFEASFLQYTPAGILCPLVIQWRHSTPWLFIDPLDGAIDPWGPYRPLWEPLG